MTCDYRLKRGDLQSVCELNKRLWCQLAGTDVKVFQVFFRLRGVKANELFKIVLFKTLFLAKVIVGHVEFVDFTCSD